MVNRESAERAVKDANPIIDGRKANVNLAYLGAKPRNGFLQNGNNNKNSFYSFLFLKWLFLYFLFPWIFLLFLKVYIWSSDDRIILLINFLLCVCVCVNLSFYFTLFYFDSSILTFMSDSRKKLFFFWFCFCLFLWQFFSIDL